MMRFRNIGLTLAAFSVCALLSVSSAAAHSLWVVTDPKTPDQVVVWYADRPEPGKASMLDRVAQVQVFAVTADGKRQPLTLQRQVTGELGALLGTSPVAGAVQFEAVCDVGVREPKAKPPAKAGEVKTGEVKTGEVKTGEVKTGEVKTAAPAGPFRQEYYAKYLKLTAAAPQATKPSAQLRIEILAARLGQDLVLTVLHEGQPAAEKSVTVAGPNGLKERLTTDAQGIVRIKDCQLGQYQVRARAELAQPGEFQGKAFEKTVRDAALVLAVE